MNFKKFAFHDSGKPRGWLRTFLLKDKHAGIPRFIARRVLFKKNGRVRAVFADWYGSYATAQKNLNYTEFLRNLILTGKLAKAKSIHIITTPHTMYIGDIIEDALKQTRLNIIKSTTMPAKFQDKIYIVVAPQVFSILPPAEQTILVQVEQVRASSWVDDSYLALLKNSLAVIDYSRDNISALIDLGLPSNQIYYMPIHPRYFEHSNNRDIDVLFYGAISSERRSVYINALRRRVNLRVESNLFGQELKDILLRTKVVVNIHFYENALLETTRISEAFTYGARVVSETSVDQGDQLFFSEIVNFVSAGDVNGFVDRVEEVLSSWKEPVFVERDHGLSGTEFHVLRALHGCGVLSFDELVHACRTRSLPAESMVLALPEQGKRYSHARDNLLEGVSPFHGLRNIIGWKGCAQSYKFIATLALKDGFSNVTVYEDDAEFDVNTSARIETIKRYLSTLGDEWDVFSGLLSDLHAESRISTVKKFESEEFIHINTVIGMVFGIYNRSAIEIISSYEFLADDSKHHTIDRYLEEKKLRCVTTFPPIAAHNEHLDSTLWGINNSGYNNLIEDSLARLEAKRATWMMENPQAEQ